MLFYLFPEWEIKNNPIEYYVPSIQITVVPRTIQKTRRRPPLPTKPFIPLESEEEEIIEDVRINQNEIKGESDSLSYQEFLAGVPLSFKPRQILEVVPQNVNEDIRGIIILQLRIGISGKVTNYRVILNSTDSDVCLQNAIDAAKKSVWEAAVVNDKPVIYWIEKTYKFNL